MRLAGRVLQQQRREAQDLEHLLGELALVRLARLGLGLLAFSAALVQLGRHQHEPRAARQRLAQQRVQPVEHRAPVGERGLLLEWPTADALEHRRHVLLARAQQHVHELLLARRGRRARGLAGARAPAVEAAAGLHGPAAVAPVAGSAWVDSRLGERRLCPRCLLARSLACLPSSPGRLWMFSPLSGIQDRFDRRWMSRHKVNTRTCNQVYD